MLQECNNFVFLEDLYVVEPKKPTMDYTHRTPI